MTAVAETVADRVGAIDWDEVGASLDVQGFARLPPVLDGGECRALADGYPHDAQFRSRIDMSRFRFGVGEYKYFAAPPPPLVQSLREALYARLAPIANRWVARIDDARLKPRATTRLPHAAATGVPAPASRSARLQPSVNAFPPSLGQFLSRCHGAGQTRPTPLLLSYATGGYNCLHQDIYGDLAFPLQAVFVLSRADADYTGGEFLLVEQRPRAQSRAHALRIEQGAGVVFATRERPAAGSRGDYRVSMRHGVSTVASGSRMSLGIIFHDAR